MRRRPTRAIDAVLVFDGGCGFCTAAVTYLGRTLPAPPPAVPSQTADLGSLHLTPAEAAERVWLVTPTRRYGGHLAASALLRRQPNSLLRFLGWLIAAPPFSAIAALGYRLIARHRHRLPGGTPACAIRPDEASTTDRQSLQRSTGATS